MFDVCLFVFLLFASQFILVSGWSNFVDDEDFGHVLMGILQA